MRRQFLLGGMLVLGVAGFLGAEEEGGGGSEQKSSEQGARKNITLGAMYCEEFKQQEGVQRLKNGIMYKVEATGKGKTPKTSDWIKVNYAGKHVDGKVFDQSKEGEPRRFRVDRTVMGWQEVLPKMREGDKWEVVVPSHLAYGVRGTPTGSIGANETLVFTIDLVEVEDPAKKVEAKQP